MEDHNEMTIYQNEDGTIKLDVEIKDDTVWLTQSQMTELFGRDRTVITKHINNIFKEKEVEKERNVHFLHIANSDKPVSLYSLDVIISVGYRVKSQQGTNFRIWANQVLKQYLIQGYAINEERIKQLGMAVEIMKRTAEQLDSKQILDVIDAYMLALDMLDDYDHETLKKPAGKRESYRLDYNECRKMIDNMKFASGSKIFGNEKDESFKSSINAIYQTFDDKELYPSLEEKAANLIYFITKNHSFSDGNKRISAMIFLYFLNKNAALFINGQKVIEDHTLVALIIMISESKPEEKETMVKLVMNFINIKK